MPAGSVGERHFRGWIPPEGVEGADAAVSLRIYNSLTDRKEVFVPHGGPGSKQVTWYSCGPTVYDSAHMGHSRNYVTIDIVRRVLEDYFGYSVLFVMNITDVEDKIVLRARRNHLLERYQRSASSVAQVRADAEGAVADCLRKQQAAVQAATADADAAVTQAEEAVQAARASDGGDQAVAAQQQARKRERQLRDLQAVLVGEQHKLKGLQAVSEQLRAGGAAAQALADGGDEAGGVAHLVGIAGDQLALWQDRLHGASVTDERIFTQHAQRFEAEFWADMDALGNRRPSVTTRVTEFMPQIVAYIQQIMANGFAYASGGEQQRAEAADGQQAPRSRSVYFDTAAFERSGHTYAKLNPWAAGSAALAADGEANFATAEKRGPKDFALWKAAKPGEPTWPSPWGRGRPGWHIECSAMASSVIGSKVDIHTGGEDLRFPHHDNELAQAEAFYHAQCGCHAQWVNYFMHSGHLSIEGLKMSKSLKNFVTIREALQRFSARQLRLMFALQPWHAPMVFGGQMREEMRAKERALKHFFQNVDVLLRKAGGGLAVHEEMEAELEARLAEEQGRVHAALLDNLSTAGALEALGRLISAGNKYMLARETQQGAPGGGPPPHPELLRRTAGFVTRILRVFGVSQAGEGQLGLGGPGLTASREQLAAVLADFRGSVAAHPELRELCGCAGAEQTAAGGGAQSAEATLDALTGLRARVRACARQLRGDKALAAAHRARLDAVLEQCDHIRDETMVGLGVRMEDRPDGGSAWVAEDAGELRAEAAERRAARAAAAAAADLLKLERQLPLRLRELDKAQRQAALPTVQQALAQQYSRFDGEGQAANPTHDAAGDELSPEAAKKARGAADKARKTRAHFDKQVAEKGPDFLDDLRREVAQLEREIQEERARLAAGA